MMYFEYENTQKHEKEGAIKIRKTDANEAEIINIDIPEEVSKDKKDEKDEQEKKEEVQEKNDEKIETPETKEENEDNLDDNFKINDNNNDKTLVILGDKDKKILKV